MRSLRTQSSPKLFSVLKRSTNCVYDSPQVCSEMPFHLLIEINFWAIFHCWLLHSCCCCCCIYIFFNLSNNTRANLSASYLLLCWACVLNCILWARWQSGCSGCCCCRQTENICRVVVVVKKGSLAMVEAMHFQWCFMLFAVLTFKNMIRQTKTVSSAIDSHGRHSISSQKSCLEFFIFAKLFNKQAAKILIDSINCLLPVFINFFNWFLFLLAAHTHTTFAYVWPFASYCPQAKLILCW